MRPALVLGVLVTACGINLARPPVPRIRVSPTTVPQADGYATAVTLDGTASRDDLADPAGALTYNWAVDDPTARFEGSVTAPMVTVRLAGGTPAGVRLTVRTADGREANTTARIALTVP